MGHQRKYTDGQLASAIAESTSWRGVLRELGLTASSSAAMRSVRSHADTLCLDYDHFKGRRRWTEVDLRRAVAHSSTWSEVAEVLELDACDIEVLRGHAARLDLDVAHLTPLTTEPTDRNLTPSPAHLDRAGSLLAAAWFTLSGLSVSWPLEPSRFDLLVSTRDAVRRVQVKTTTVRVGRTWKVYLSTSRRKRRTYDPDEIDDFFIIDGDLSNYLIPVSVVGGLHAIHLAPYEQYRLPSITGSL